MVTEKILNADTKYFADIAETEKKSFLIECSLKFDKGSSKACSLDLPGLPTVRRVHSEEIGNYQFFEYKRTKISFDKMPPKLVSDLSNGLHTEFIDALFFLQLFFGAEVTKIHRIVSFKTNAYMKDYCLRLCKLRSETESAVLNRVFKTYTNAIPGKKNQYIICDSFLSSSPKVPITYAFTHRIFLPEPLILSLYAKILTFDTQYKQYRPLNP